MKANSIIRKIGLPAVIILLLCSFTQSEKSLIHGIICDEFKKPLPDVEILNTANSFVTVSDKSGHYVIRGKSGDLLKFTFPGKLAKQANASDKNFKTCFDDQEKINAKAQRKAHRLAKRQARKNRKTSGQPAIVNHKVYSNPYRKNIIGMVSDNSGPLPGANVMIKGTHIGTQTDIDGYYGIDAKIGDVIVFSFVGMRDVSVKADKRITNVVMESSGIELEEVVTDAYKEKNIVIRGSSAVMGTPAISGKVAGLSVGHTSIAYDGYLKKSEGYLKPGQLTAGEVNDFGKWEYWEGLTKDELNQWEKYWVQSPTFRYSAVITNTLGFAVCDRTLYLTDGNGNKLWTAKTDNTGRAELWYKPEELGTDKSENLSITDDKETVIVKSAKEFHDGINTYVYNEKCKTPQKIDIAFMVDATGSMGDEIQYLQSELDDVINRTKKALPDAELSLGSVFYRDFNDEYLVKNFDFTQSIPNVISFIRKQNANGGDDYPEAVVEAYEAAIDNMSWDDDARARLLFVVLDAPPHYTPENVIKLQNLARKAAEKGIRIIPIAASGTDKSTEYLMRSMALQTNGTYLFITNDSGIGNDHIKPSTDNYKVEMLNDLILRIILQFTETANCDSKALPVNTKLDQNVTAAASIKWEYFPNPTSGVVTVSIDKEADGLLLYDTTGKLVLQRIEKSRRYEIDLGGLPSAVYYLKITVGDETLYGKIIKKI